jgi:heme-degrading monooxygenase HmoA
MICVINLYEIDKANIAAFVSAFDLDGPWQRISSRLPGYVYTNLLRRATHLLYFLVQEFWESEDDYANAESNDEVYSFCQSLRTLAVCQLSLGIFRFRDQWEQEQNSDNTYRKTLELQNWQMD